MHFGNVQVLYWLWAVIVFVLFLWWGLKRRRTLLERFAQTHLLTEIVLGPDQRRQIWKISLLAGVLVFSILALSRPQWGFEWQEIKQEGLDILLLIDTSKSMLTQDVKPNRLDRTKLAVKDFIRKLQGDRVGLIAFAGDAFLTCPLTSDYNGFLLSLDDLDVRTIPRGGTNIGAAIGEALKSYDKTPSQFKAIVILTDGDNLEGDPLAVAKKAKELGIKIYTIGIGTKEGDLIQIADENGKAQFLKDTDGNFVKSRLNERLLQNIALTTGGAYAYASGAEFGLDVIYDRELAKQDRREIKAQKEKHYFERFQYPLAVALALLILEVCLPVRRNTKEI